MNTEPKACEDRPDALVFLRTVLLVPPQFHCRGLFLMKCGSGRYASTGVRRMPEAALFAAQGSRLTTREAGRCNSTRRKAEVPVQLRQA